jgi:polyisoprenyl-phosphate glycosyltransferase
LVCREPVRVEKPLNKTLSIVVPCYNEEAVLPSMYDRLTAICHSLELDYEIVLVNDGSKDRTWQIMQNLAENDGRLVCVNLSRNHGHQLALSTGLQESCGDMVLAIDADLQDPPELLPRMIDLMQSENADVVYGQRLCREGEPKVKSALSYVFYRVLNWFSEIQIPPDAGDFRLLSRRVVDTIVAMPEQHRYLRGLVTWVGYKQIPLPYRRQPRAAGQSNYNFARLSQLALDGIIGFSKKPLTLAIRFGVLCLFAAMIVLFGSMWTWYKSSEFPSLGFLTALLLLLSGTQFLALGVIGEYLGRMYSEIRGRPLVIVDRIIRESQTKNRILTPKIRQRVA